MESEEGLQGQLFGPERWKALEGWFPEALEEYCAAGRQQRGWGGGGWEAAREERKPARGAFASGRRQRVPCRHPYLRSRREVCSPHPRGRQERSVGWPLSPQKGRSCAGLLPLPSRPMFLQQKLRSARLSVKITGSGEAVHGSVPGPPDSELPSSRPAVHLLRRSHVAPWVV